MASVYADENFPIFIVQRLRALGHDVVTVQDSLLGGSDDPTVLAFAQQDKRVVLTFNRKDFIRLHNLDSSHAGIIVCTFDIDFEALAQRIHHVLSSQESFETFLIRINKSSVN